MTVATSPGISSHRERGTRMWRTAAHREVVNSVLRLTRRVGGPTRAHDGMSFGSPEYRAASALAAHACEAGWVRAGARALIAGRSSAVVLLSLLELPTVTLALEPWEERAWHADPFPPAAMPIFGGYLGQAVLDLQPDDDEYLRGHYRRQMRTRCRRATGRGVQVEELDDFDQWFPLARQVLGERPGGPDELARMAAPDPAQRMGWFAAADRWGQPVALGGVAIFGTAGVVFSLVGRPGSPEAGDARYLLHCFMRSRLRARGVRHLVAGAALRLPQGLQLFQSMLGYRVCNLLIVHRDGPEPGPGSITKVE